MSGITRQTINALVELGNIYVDTYLQKWDRAELKGDWYLAFKLLLSRIYFQGRRDELSQTFLTKMEACLDNYFRPNPTDKLRDLINTGAFSGPNCWKAASSCSISPLWELFDATMGKKRDHEMTLDALRYVSGLEGYNVVNHAVTGIGNGNITRLRSELRGIRSVGAKTSAFFLRDVTLIFGLKLRPAQLAEIQAIDTWVEQLVMKLAGPEIDPVNFLVAQVGTDFCPARVNAGAWYLGKHSFPILVDLLTRKPETLATLLEISKPHG